MSDKYLIPENSNAYLSENDIKKLERDLFRELNKKGNAWNKVKYSKNELNRYIKEAIEDYLRIKQPAVDLPTNIDKLNGSQAKQKIENMLTSVYKYLLGYDPEGQYSNWQSWGAEGEIKEIARLFGEMLRATRGETIGSTDVIIQKGWTSNSVKFESKDAERWVGSVNAIRLLYKIILEKESQIRAEFIMDKLDIYESELYDASGSNDSLSTSRSSSRRNSASARASDNSLSATSRSDGSLPPYAEEDPYPSAPPESEVFNNSGVTEYKRLYPEI